MSNFDQSTERQVKSSIYLDRIRPEFIYVLFLSNNPKCKNSAEIMEKISAHTDFGQVLNIMEIESLPGQLPNYVDGVPMLVMQHKQTGQIAPPMRGVEVFNWFKEMIKPTGGGSGGGGGSSGPAAAGADTGVSIRNANKLRFDPRRIDGNNRDPGQFQIPIDQGRSNDDVNQKLAAMAEEAKQAWAPRSRPM